MSIEDKIVYARKVVPSATWRALNSSARGPVHLIFALADHFEPAIDPEDGQKRVPRSEQERRLESWMREYPKIVDQWRDHDGRPFVHTYFYPAEQYHRDYYRRNPTPPKIPAASSPNSATSWPFDIAVSH